METRLQTTVPASDVLPNQPGLVGLLLQALFPVSTIRSGDTTATATRDLETTAPDSCRDDGVGEPGPLELNVLNLPQYPALPDVRPP